MIYEIQKFGVTVEWTDVLKEAEDAYAKTSFGGVVMYRIAGSEKIVMRTK